MSRALEQMAASDADIALRKIDVTNPGAAEEHNIQALPHVKVYNRGGSLVGTVVGLDVEKIKVTSRRRRVDRQVSIHPRANASTASTSATNCPEIRVYSSLPFPDHVLQVRRRRMISVRPYRRSDFDRANFFHGLLGANVVFSNEEHDALNKLEGVIQQ